MARTKAQFTPEGWAEYCKKTSIRQMMKRGKTREQAEAHYNQPLGVCSKCGKAAWNERARTCNDCLADQHRISQRALELTPEQIAKHRRAAVIRHNMKRGKTREEAEQIADKPRGVCATCQKPAETKSGRRCRDCILNDAKQRSKGKRRRYKGVCPCGAEFVGVFDRKFCDLHNRGKGIRPKKAPKPKAVKAATPKPLPKQWEEPLPNHRKFAAPEPVAPVVVPAGFQVKRYDHTGALVSDLAQATRGLRDLFGSGRSAADH